MTQYKYLFVFSESYEKTNIQFGEFISLLKLQKNNVVIKEYNQREGFSFGNGQEVKIDYNTSFDSIITCEDTVVVINFFQSLIAISNFELDIFEIIRRAGYIQSCGEFIFLYRWEELNTELISNTLCDFFERNKEIHECIFYKASENEKINNRLDQLLIDDERYHIGKESFSKAEKKIQTKLINFGTENSYKERDEPIFIFKEQGKLLDSSGITNFYHDRDIIHYCICYASMYKKDNPIHYIDESKPFWAGIFTTPHRLMNSMLNLAEVQKDSLVLDPFSHTGTLAIESSQIGCEIIAADISEIQGAKDNYDFLCNGHESYNKLLSEISNNMTDLKKNIFFQSVLSDSISLNLQGHPEVKDEYKIDILLKKHKKDEHNFNNLGDRLYFYLLRRYYMQEFRGAFKGFSSGADFVSSVLKKETEEGETQEKKLEGGLLYFGNQLKIFEDSFNKVGKAIIDLNDLNNKENEVTFSDEHYKSKRVGYIPLSFLHKKTPKFEYNDIINSSIEIRDKSIDAIVTDPPYGYGEGLSLEKVKEIYESLFKLAFKVLKPGGRLVFCALDKVKTGRKEGLIFTEDILDIANEVAIKSGIVFQNRDLINMKANKNFVYFWKSKYALNRSIVSLQVS